MTEQQIPKLLGSLVEHQIEFAELSSADAQWAIQNTKEAIALFVMAVRNRTKKVEEKIVLTLLGLVKMIRLRAVHGGKTVQYFINKSWCYYHDKNLDNWLPKNQPDQAESTYSVQRLTRPATFKEAVESYLGITGDIATLAAALKERKLTTTLPAIETLIERQENGEEIGLRTENWANFFFVEDKDGGVLVVDARRDGSQWCVDVRRLEDGHYWLVENRFFFRN